MKPHLKLFILAIYVTLTYSADPFSLLGIPSLDPSVMFRESPGSHQLNQSGVKTSLKSIEDLHSFLKHSNLDPVSGMAAISKFLISDDYRLKGSGVVYDESGFDGLKDKEPIYPINTLGRFIQRARSSSQIYVSIVLMLV